MSTEEASTEILRHRPPNLEQLKADPGLIRLQTAPYDPRFPNTNQTGRCWQHYMDYHKCVRAHGGDEDEPTCAKFKRQYRIMCPDQWVDSIFCQKFHLLD